MEFNPNMAILAILRVAVLAFTRNKTYFINLLDVFDTGNSRTFFAI